MRFKITKWTNNSEYKKKVTCVAWNSADEIYSCGEDHVLTKWCLKTGNVKATPALQFSSEFYPTQMQWHPRSLQTFSTNIKNQSLDVLLITSADGKFYFVSKNGRIEKIVDAHKGAVLSGQWIYDGSALLTAGEDGMIRIWSRSGMLRSTIVRATQPILAASWSPDCTSILYTQETQLVFQSLNTSTKPLKWYAHEGLVLTVSWNRHNGVIVSGGEDCRYKLWDSSGNLLFSSGAVEYPITAVNWCPNGMYFVAGFCNTIKLCDVAGWVHSLQKIDAGNINCMAWSNDGAQLAITCGSSSIITAHLIDRRLEWNNYVATLIGRKIIEIHEVKSEHIDTFEISDKVLHFEFAFDHLVVVTPSQCHIYSSINWNTPAIFELKNVDVSAVLLADKHFVLVEWNSLTLYSYQGRLLSVPKWKGMSQEPLHTSCIAVSSTTLVAQDQSDKKILHIVELASNKPVLKSQQYIHPRAIIKISINATSDQNLQQLAMIDINSDLFLITIRSNGLERAHKIAAMAQSIAWASDAHVLVAMLDASLSIWLCPSCVHFSDKTTIRKTRVDKDNSEFGKQPSIVRVQNGIVTVRRSDGAVVSTACYTAFMCLHRYIINEKWQKALSLCRIAQNEILWTCLAVGADEKNEISAAEEAYSAIERYDKVEYIRRIKSKTEK